MSRTPSPDEARRAVREAASDAVPAPDKEFWESAEGLRDIRDWARARRSGPYALLGEILLQVGARIPPQVVLPPLGAEGDGSTKGAASLNQLVASVGPSGISKGACHQLAGEIVAWPLEVPGPVYAPLGSGEGIAATFVVGEKGEDGQVVMRRLAWSGIYVATEIDRMTALLGRSGATLGSVLRAAWSGEPLGEANAAVDRRRYVPRHGYRAGMMVHVQPARAGALLSPEETAAGTPQRILWLPAADPDIPDVAPLPPPLIQWQPPDEVLLAIGDLEKRGMSELGNLDLLVMPVCDAARVAIDQAAVARHRGEANALDGHALLLREKLAAVLAAYLGRWGVNEATWDLAGHLMRVSEATRSTVAGELRRAEEARNDARGHAEASRAMLVSESMERAEIAKVAKRAREVLVESGGWVSWSDLRRRISGRRRPLLEDAIADLLRAGDIERDGAGKTAGGHGGDGSRYRVAGHPSHPGHPGLDQPKQRSPRSVTPVTPAPRENAPGPYPDVEVAGQSGVTGKTAGQARGDRNPGAGVTGKTAGQARGDRGDRGDRQARVKDSAA